jgi:hypothetical protein
LRVGSPIQIRGQDVELSNQGAEIEIEPDLSREQFLERLAAA